MLWLNPSSRAHHHEKLSQSDDEEPLHISSTMQRDRSRHVFSWGLTAFNLFLTLLTITVVSLPEKPQKYIGLYDSVTTQTQCDCEYEAPADSRYKNHDLNPDLKKVSGYSPLLDEVDLTPQPKILNGHFHDNSTIFMRDPSPEVDAAWSFFSDDIFLTDYPSIRDSGRSLSKSIHFPPSTSASTGAQVPGKYIATFDVFHQIHCLNWLRKATHWEYYYGEGSAGEGGGKGKVYEAHQRHCIHMLLQSLMCSADTDMITFEWMEGHDERVDGSGSKAAHGGQHELETAGGEGDRSGFSEEGVEKRALAGQEGDKQDAIPAANFHVHKMCRNFDALVEWAKKNKEADPREVRRKLVVPEDVQLIRWKDY